MQAIFVHVCNNDGLVVNHSCDPSTLLVDCPHIMVARHDLQVGDAVTCDYATFDAFCHNFACSCESKNCRGQLSPKDWMLPELWQRYGTEGFSPFLQRKIKELQSGPISSPKRKIKELQSGPISSPKRKQQQSDGSSKKTRAVISSPSSTTTHCNDLKDLANV